MEKNITLKYTENSVNKTEIKIVSNSIVPVEVFIFFMIYNQDNYTVTDLIKLFDNKHKIKLPFDRMQQILQDLCAAGKLKIHRDKNKLNHIVNYYSFKNIL